MRIELVFTECSEQCLVQGHHIYMCVFVISGGSDGKESACNVGDSGLIPDLGRSLGEGNGNPLQYSCLNNPKDRGTWRDIVHGVAKSWT